MPETGNEVLSASELPMPARPATPEMEEIARKADELARQRRAVQSACSGEDPHLGLATTEELIEELYARMKVQLAQPTHLLDLHYRTVDDDTPERHEEHASLLLTQANAMRGEDPSREAQRG